jgi:hypothetical protein
LSYESALHVDLEPQTCRCNKSGHGQRFNLY